MAKDGLFTYEKSQMGVILILLLKEATQCQKIKLN